MADGRSSEDGFRGEYPAQLDWDKIIAELAQKPPADSKPPQRDSGTLGRQQGDE